MMIRKLHFCICLILIVTGVNLYAHIQHSRHPSYTIIPNLDPEKPYLILISLDGFRWDYLDRFEAPNLKNFVNNGVKAVSLIPSFPSKTFPNHYTIATGMYPDKHGLLGNNFYNYDKSQTYNIRDRDKVEDGEYYGGTPIWVQAENSGIISASYFFVGTEANIQGKWPTYHYKFNDNVRNEDRVSQALKWLALPEKKRPHLITMYFSDMDKTGHRYGPNADQDLQNTLLALDEVLGQLFRGIKSSGLPVNVIIVSDHGMKDISVDHYIPVEKIKDDELYFVINNGSIVNIHLNDSSRIDSIYLELVRKQEHFKVYKTAEVPYFESIPTNKNWGTLQAIPDESYYFSDLRTIGIIKNTKSKIFGQHGFNPETTEMHGIFYANGPAFKTGYIIPSIKNIHIFPLMCSILGLDIPENIDGKLSEIEQVLRK